MSESVNNINMIEVPVGMLDLVRFLAETWVDVDRFVWQNAKVIDIFKYPAIQGTSNQFKLQEVAEQKKCGCSKTAAINWMLGRGSLDGVKLVNVPDGMHDLVCFLSKTWVDIDAFVWANVEVIDIENYPVIQGASNQINIKRISEKFKNGGDIAYALEWILKNGKQ